MKKNINQFIDNPINKNYFIPWLIIISFILRLISAYFFKDIEIDNEWSRLLNNLAQYKSYSYYTFGGQLIPSTFLPPIYPFFLYLIKMSASFNENNFLYYVILKAL